MMQPVCLVDALEVTFARNVLEGPALVHQPVMEHEVEKAVYRNAETYPGEGPPPRFPGKEQQDGDTCEHDRIKIVLLERVVMRLVVRFVPSPAPGVHDVPVRPGGEPFHEHHRAYDEPCRYQIIKGSFHLISLPAKGSAASVRPRCWCRVPEGPQRPEEKARGEVPLLVRRATRCRSRLRSP